MGLDMYLEGRTFLWNNWGNPDADLKRDGFRVKGLTLELGYWRKHPNLHGYIVQHFAKGVDECQKIPLDADNIRQIIAAIKAKQLPETEGFFFGQSDGSEDDESIEIFEKALAWLEASTPPKELNPIPLGGGVAVIKIDPKDIAQARESRDVVYQASW